MQIGLDQNLDLAISRANTKQKKFTYYSALGNFLPDPNLGYSLYVPAPCHVGLPISAASIFGGSSALAGSGTLASSSLLGTTGTTGGTTTIPIRSNFQIMHGGADFYAYRGGSILFGALQAKHNYKAARFQEKASLSDTLLTITQNYYNCVLAETILQIRVDAVRTSEEQLRRNRDRFASGLATNLDVLQSAHPAQSRQTGPARPAGPTAGQPRLPLPSRFIGTSERTFCRSSRWLKRFA